MRFLTSFCAAAATIALALLPLALSADYGGVLRWTQYLAVLGIIATAFIGLLSQLTPESTVRWNRYVVLLVLALWAGYCWLQTIPLSSGLVGLLSPGSATAYTDWVQPFIDAPSQFPISLDKDSSIHAAAILTSLIAFVWVGLVVLDTRFRIGAFLLAVAIGVSIHALFGFWCLADPEMDAAGISGFGRFVNRNNAALFLNFGMAASLGLLSWRLNALTGQAVDDVTFELNDLFSLINDRDSMLGIVCATACLGGLLTCGSRGGLGAAMVGALLAFGWVRQRRGMIAIPVVSVAIGICLAVVFIPTDLNFESIDRIEKESTKERTALFNNGRLLHWADGWKTAKAHMPGGSGLGTYAYAYLPYQESSPGSWFHHADNLWLEAIVEQGLPGIAFICALLFLLVRSLFRLSDSPDPIDQGLRTMSWYALGVVLFSQCLDFGLIIPANLYLFAALSAAVIARGDSIYEMSRTDAPPRSLFLSWRVRASAVALGLVVIGLSGAVLPVLHQDAVCESVVLAAHHQYDEASRSRSQLDARLAALNPHRELDPRVVMASSKLQHQRARLEEVYEESPPTEDGIVDAYKNTSRSVRRMRWQTRTATDKVEEIDWDTQPESMLRYRSALNDAFATLKQLPLSLEARSTLVYLDFIYRNQKKSRTAIEQLAQLQARNPDRLMKLAILASDSGELEIAKEQWKLALDQAPYLTKTAIEIVGSQSELLVSEIVPSAPRNQRLAARYLLNNDELNDTLKKQVPEFLHSALNKIDCEKCESNRERAQCEELAGDILFSLDRSNDSFPHYVTAIEVQPANPNLRVKYIGRLRFAGKRDEARKAAQRARHDIPNQPRFQRIIDEIAAQDLREAKELDLKNEK